MAGSLSPIIVALTLGLAAPLPALAQDGDTSGAAAPVGAWLVQTFEGASTDAGVETTLVITPGGRASGTGGCNRFNAEAMIDGEQIHFGQAIATRMACQEAAMRQEAEFFAALSNITAWRVLEDGRLELTDAAGQAVLTLTRGQSA